MEFETKLGRCYRHCLMCRHLHVDHIRSMSGYGDFQPEFHPVRTTQL